MIYSSAYVKVRYFRTTLLGPELRHHHDCADIIVSEDVIENIINLRFDSGS